jgi:glycosyltransferase involved in cell wall biosynthesis
MDRHRPEALTVVCEPMNKIAVFIADYSIDYSPSILHLLDYLSETFRVELFIKNVHFKRSRILRKENISVIEVRPRLNWRWFWNDLRCKTKEIIKYSIGRNRKMVFTIGKRLTLENTRAETNARIYLAWIAIEPQGLILCKEIFPACHPIYYSLELYLRSDLPRLGQDEMHKLEIMRMMENERRYIHDISGLIIQSREKENLFRHDYELADTVPSLTLPVTGQGNAVREKSNYLHRMLHIPDGKKIALHLGGMNSWFSCLEIAREFATLDGWVIVFQGNHNREYLRHFQRMIRADKTDNIIVLKKFYTEINSLDCILMSCDLGIAWYNDISLNFRTAGQSSGKIASYLKFGLPIVANRYPSTEEALAKPGCGICVDNMNEIPEALGTIAKNYTFFSANALREYERTYRFENYHQSLNEFLNL